MSSFQVWALEARKAKKSRTGWSFCRPSPPPAKGPRETL